MLTFGEAGPVTTTSEIPLQNGAEKATCSARSGVMVRPAMARSPRPSRRAGMRSPRETGMHKAAILRWPVFRLRLT